MSKKQDDLSSTAPSFESAFARLETILEQMNSGEASLDDSLKLFEEADQLIRQCQKRLTDAEKKVERLIKSRSGEVLLDDSGQPQTEAFGSPQSIDPVRTDLNTEI